jgi:hypothetical protein
MNRILLIAGALVILAGAFPAEAVQVIAWSSQMISTITSSVTPGQQMALLIVAVAIGVYALSR